MTQTKNPTKFWLLGMPEKDILGSEQTVFNAH